MRAIQVMLDEPLLARLARDPEVLRSGRSAVLRRAAAEYLRRSSARRIREAYEKAYGGGAGADLEGWAEEGSWPEK